MATLSSVLALGMGHLGHHGRPNKFANWYSNRHRKPFKLEPWCAMFASYVGHQAGMSKEYGEFAYCPSWVNWFKNKKRWGTKPRLGAVVFFDWDNDGLADHVGIVTEVLAGGKIHSLEGNTTKGGLSNVVAIQTRKPGDVLGYGYVSYASITIRTHTVKTGETLSEIAKRFGVTWQSLYATNKSVIGPDPGVIRPGQKLKIP